MSEGYIWPILGFLAVSTSLILSWFAGKLRGNIRDVRKRRWGAYCSVVVFGFIILVIRYTPDDWLQGDYAWLIGIGWVLYGVGICGLFILGRHSHHQYSVRTQGRLTPLH